MTTDSQDIQIADDITRRGLPTRPTAIRALALIPSPAYGTRLRGQIFIYLDGAAGFIVQLDNYSGITGTAHLLRLLISQRLCRSIKRLADIASSTRTCFCHLAGSFVYKIAQATMRFLKHPGLAALQAFPASRALDFGALCLCPVAFAVRPLTRIAFSLSVAASNVLTPRSTPMTVCWGIATSGTS